MAASYPAAIKNFSTIVNGVTKLVAALFNSPYDEITAIETELGTDPAGSVADVKTRLAVALNNDGTLKTVATTYGGTGVAGKAFNVVHYTGTTANQTVAHGMGATPTFIIFNSTDSGSYIGIWTNGQGTNIGSSSGSYVQGYSAVPDATNLYLFGAANYCNVNGKDYYAICFAI